MFERWEKLPMNKNNVDEKKFWRVELNIANWSSVWANLFSVFRKLHNRRKTAFADIPVFKNLKIVKIEVIQRKHTTIILNVICSAFVCWSFCLCNLPTTDCRFDLFSYDSFRFSPLNCNFLKNAELNQHNRTLLYNGLWMKSINQNLKF